MKGKEKQGFSRERPVIPEPTIPKVRLTTPMMRYRPKNEEKTLFDPKDIQTTTDIFDITSPAEGEGESLLESRSKGLYAFRNKAAKGNRKINNETKVRAKTAMGNSSVLVKIKRPMTASKPLKIPALERVKQQNDMEKQAIDFKEDPVAYFSKRKDGRGHRFIYLIYRDDPKDPFFSPYELKKVPASEITKDYFMMSATGVTHYFEDESTETTSLDNWAQETSIFKSIRKLKIFAQYFYWKSFRIWRNFVMNQRYSQIENRMVAHPILRNVNFFIDLIGINDELQRPLELIDKYLLSFKTDGQYQLKAYMALNRYNAEELKSAYTEYIFDMVQHILDIYAKVSDPARVQVFDKDFPEIRRRNPNLAQLMILEKKKAATRAAKTESVNQEIISIGGYIRMVDYIILEALNKGCIEAWRAAEAVVSQEKTSVFKVEVNYTNEGDVILQPSKEDLIDTIIRSLDDSLKTLNLLPRILNQQTLLPYLRDNGLNLKQLFAYCPQFIDIVRCSEELQRIQDKMVSVFESSYEESFNYSQRYSDYYPIYKLKETWNVHDYLITRSGNPYTGDLSDTQRGGIRDSFLENFDEEPVINFEKVTVDIERFRADKIRVTGLSTTNAKGALFIDAHAIREYMLPIIDKALSDLESMLRQLVDMKISLVTNVLKYYSGALQKEQKTLDGYVSFCDLITKTEKATPNIEEEIRFIDRAYEMFDQFDFQHSRNVLWSNFASFQQVQQNASVIRKSSFDIFVPPLTDKVKELELKLQSYYEKATLIPATIKDADIDDRLPQAEKLREKVAGLRPQVDEIIRYQTTIGTQVSSFDLYDEVVSVSTFAVNLYESLKQWDHIATIMKMDQFQHIDIKSLKEEVNKLLKCITDLHASAKISYSILAELLSRVQETAQFMIELELLANGNMRLQNWHALYKATGNPPSSYHESVTIEELISLGILKAKDKIAEITTISRGEYEIFSEFEKITEEWQRVQMPFVDMAFRTEENLKLGDTSELLSHINRNIGIFTRMFVNPYVASIRDNVLEQLNQLENYSHIIESWQAFQNNWTILSSLFQSEETKQILPHQANRIVGIQRKWSPIAKHTLKDTRVVASCQFPGLRDNLDEMNQSLESILSNLGKFLDTKRQSSPRLYFLTNDETLLLISTNQLSIFAPILRKLFMHIEKIDCHEKEANPNDTNSFLYNITRLRIYGLIGQDGDTLSFTRPVSCATPMETWMPQLMESMRNACKDAIANAIPNCTGQNLVDWMLQTTSYAAFISLYVMFTNEVKAAFEQYDQNNSSFRELEQLMKIRIDSTAANYNLVTGKGEHIKIALLLTVLLGFRDTIRKLIRVRPPSEMEWLQMLRFSYRITTNTVVLELGENSWEHGYEFWGHIPRVIHTASIDDANQTIQTAIGQGVPSVLVGSAANGKLELLRMIGAQFGRFVYVFRGVPGHADTLITRTIIGAATSGVWAVFADISMLSQRSLAVLHDNVRILTAAQAIGNPRITINSKFIDLSKSTRLFMTDDTTYQSNPNIPPQLKSYVRAVALSNPDLHKVCQIKLMACGFREADIITPCLVEMVNSAMLLFTKAYKDCSHMHHYQSIIERAEGLIKKCGNEEMAIAYSSFLEFFSFCSDERRKTLLNIIFSQFRIVNSADDLAQRFDEFNNDEVLTKLIEKEVRALDINLPGEYIVPQCINLNRMLKQNNCTIIFGPPNSGKSTILKLLQNVYSRNNIKETIPEAKPLDIRYVYHCGSSTDNVFGSAKENSTTGYMMTYGAIDASLYSFRKNGAQNLNILVFDGPITHDLVVYLTKVVKPFGEMPFHIIVETDNIENATPTLLTKCGMIVMRDVQAPLLMTKSTPTWELQHPLLPLTRAMSAVGDLPISQMDTVRSVFCEIAPLFVKKVLASDTWVTATENRPGIPGSSVLISEILPMYGAIQGLVMLKDSNSATVKDQVIQCLLIGLTNAYLGILEEEQRKPFERWARSLYGIDTPEDWFGFTVPQIFIDEYPPSINTLRLYQGKLVPISTSILEANPIFRGTQDNEMPFHAGEITIIPPIWTPQLSVANAYLSCNTHMIIHGPMGCGKSSFVHCMFADKYNIKPIIISSSPNQSYDSLVSFIKKHTSLLSMTVAPEAANITYALIFDNVKHTDIILQAFIRRIVNRKEIPEFSSNDQKVYDVLSMRKFFCIVITREYNSFPIRFLSLFSPIQVPIPSVNSSVYISQRLLKFCGIRDNDAKFITDFTAKTHDVLSDSQKSLDIIKTAQLVTLIYDVNNKKLMMSLLICSMFLVWLHKYPKDRINKVIVAIFDEMGLDDDMKKAVNEFVSQDTLFSPEMVKLDGYQIKLNATSYLVHDLVTDLQSTIFSYNNSSTEKVSLKIKPFNLMSFLLLKSMLMMPGQNVFLFGESGTGKYTLTRLAAHACEYDFVQVCPPSHEESLLQEERMATISNIIKDVVTNACISQRKTVIFIRAIRANLDAIQFFSSFVTNTDFTSFFSPETVDELYMRFLGVQELTIEQRMNAMRRIQRIIGANVTLVVAGGAEAISILPSSVHAISVTMSDIENKEQIANSLILNESTPEEITEIAPTLVKILVQAVKECPGKKYSSNMFTDFVCFFLKTVTEDIKNAKSKHSNLIAAIDFITKLRSEQILVNQRAKTIAPQIQRLRIDTDSLESSYTTRKEAIEARRIKLKEDRSDKEQKLRELMDEFQKLEAETSQVEPTVDKTEKIVAQLTENDVETIRITADNPHKSLSLLLDILCIFLDLPKPYEKSGPALLKDNSFIKQINEKIGYSKLTNNILKQVVPLLDNEELNPADLEANCPPLRSIYDWINSICKLRVLKDKHTQMKKKLDEETRLVNEFIEEMNLEIASIEQVEESLIKEKEDLAKSNEEREKMEVEYQSVISRQDKINRINKDIDKLFDRWMESKDDYPAKNNEIIGDAIAYAFYVIYCGHLNHKNRDDAILLIQEIIKENGLKYSFDNPMNFISDRLSRDDANQYSGILAQTATIEAHHVFAAPRTPLLFDPDGLISQVIIDTIKVKRLLVISMNSTFLEQTLVNAIQDGKTLIVQDVDGLHQLIHSIMPLSLLDKSVTNREVKIGSKVITWDPKFQLILITQTPIDQLPSDLLSNVILIDAGASVPQTTYNLLVNTFVDFFAPSLTPRISEMRRKEIGQRVMLIKFEQDVLDILGDIQLTRTTTPGYDYLDDDETVEDLIKSKECYFMNSAEDQDFTELMNEFNETIKPFLQHVKLCQIFWKALSQYILRVNSKARFSFTAYQKQISAVFANDGLHAGSLSADQHAALHNTLIATTFQFIFPSLGYNEIKFFLFVTAFMINESEGKCNMEMLDEIIAHISKERFEIADFAHSDPNDKGHLDALPFTNILNIQRYTNEFTNEVFGPDFSPVIPYFQVDNIVASSGFIPTIITCPPELDPTGIVLSFIATRCRHENFDSVSLSDDVDVIRAARRSITMSMNRGNWVLVHYTHPNRAAAGMLTDLFSLMMTTSVNTNFRLILICTSLDYISPSVLLRAKRFVIDDSATIKNTMMQLFAHHSAQIISSVNPRAIKKLSYLSALVTSLTQFRNSMKPSGLSSPVYPNDIAFKELIRQLRIILDATANAIPMKIVEDMVTQTLFGNVSDANDKRLLSDMVKRLYTLRALDDNFSLTFTDNRDVWALPPDVPLSNFTQIIAKLPWNPSAEAYGMRSVAGQLLINYASSQSISKVFSTYYGAENLPKAEVTVQRIDNMLMLMPDIIPVPSSNSSTAMQLVLLSEVEKLNNVLETIMESLRVNRVRAQTGMMTEDTIELGLGHVPVSWKKASDYWVTQQSNKFITHVIERHQMLTSWIQGTVPVSFDVTLVDNVRKLLYAFLLDTSMRLKVPASTLTYKFSTRDASSSNHINLTRISLLLGRIEDDHLKGIDPSSKIPFFSVPELICNVVEAESIEEEETISLPLYKFADNLLSGKTAGEPYDGYDNNYITEIRILCNEDRPLVEIGSSFYCQIPIQFT